MDVEKKQIIESFLTRGVETLYPSKDEVSKRLLEGKQTIYFGIDPTGPTLHLGHVSILLKLKVLQDLGHSVIFLIGDFTATIGDPSDKDSARVPLTREEVLSNAEKYKNQASKILDFDGENKAVLLYNSEWLSRMNFEEILSLSSYFTVQDMLKRDMFRRRLENEKPIYVHEFMYPLMQGYDSVAMNIDAEIGGNDQTFNMLAGRDLMKKINSKDKIVIALKLLVDSSGKKMGKTEGNMVTLTDTAEDMYGKIMSWSDDLILPGFELCTNESTDSIEEIKASMQAGDNPKDFKMKLAHSITTLLYSEEMADKSERAFQETFSEGGIPDDIETVEVQRESELAEVLLNNGLIESKGEFRRLVDQSAITNLSTDEKILTYDEKIYEDCDLKIGKKRFIRLSIK